MESSITSIQDAFHFLGVNESTLKQEEKRSLDEDGYVLFRDLILPENIQRMREAFERLISIEGKDAGKEFEKEKGARRLANLVNKDGIFDICYTHPKILAAAFHVIKRAFKLSSINGRDALPGEGHQALHADWGQHESNEPFHFVNTIWLLDDFTVDNGATRLVPGTHLLASSPGESMADPFAPHSDEVIVVAPAGTVIAYNAHLWHGGTLNQSGQVRRVLHPSFVAREFPQQQNQGKLLSKETYERLSPTARYILDV